jgi:hypothetical protein
MEELISILSAVREKESQNRTFLAALQGIDLEQNNGEQEDAASLKDFKAGFGVGMGLGYESEGE